MNDALNVSNVPGGLKVPPPLPEAAPEPFSARELARAFIRPHLLVEYVLGGRGRMGTTLADGDAIWPLAAILMAASLLATVPYGLLCPTASLWKIAALYTGSLMICWPCLYMFGQFLGIALNLARSLAMALVVTATAGLFTVAFAPIIWFITVTVEAVPQSVVSPQGLSTFLLSLALLLGVIQMGRCIVGPAALSRRVPNCPLLVTPWLVLLAFITYRMACLLGVL